MPSSITQEDREFVEVWEHISPQQWVVLHLDARGDETSEIVSGRREFRITTEERMLTEDKVRMEGKDPFQNGAFRPIVVPDSVTIETNPNALSDDEIREILEAGSELAFSENLKVIDSVATLGRMLEVAEGIDTLTVKRLRQVEDRLIQIRGVQRLEVKDPELRKFLDESDAARHRSPGMSSNYRH